MVERSASTAMLERRGLVKAAVASTTLAGPLFAVPGLRAQGTATPADGRIIVGFAAGGGADLVARVLADKFKTLQPGSAWVVENKTGAAGKIAVDAMRSAPADGATVLVAPLVTPVLSQLMFRNPGYDPGKDFAPVGLVGYFEFGLASSATLPVRSLPELLAWLKANPAKASFGSPSAGSLPHFFGVMLGRGIGVDMQHVAYRGGAPMLADLIGGQIPIGIDTQPELLEQHRAGKIRVLASFSDKRTSQLPDVPTMAELGFPKISGSGWYSMWARAGPPPATAARLNGMLNAAVVMPEVRERFAGWGVEAAPGKPADLERIRLADIERWRPVVEASGFKAD